VKLAKPHVDVALLTNERDAMLAFWQQEAGLPFGELLPTGGGNHQHRHGMNGSVLKLNHAREPLPDAPRSGYRELWIAREGIASPQALVDPDGNLVRLVPSGERGVVGVGVSVAVRDTSAQGAFYREALELEEPGPGVFRCGDSLLFVEEDPGATPDVAILGRGFRYLTIQVFDCEAEHLRILEAGGREGAPPRRLGDVAIFSMVRDPDGNWIEISQRGSLTGGLD
jgi:lactoylglutathione lyase